jgi:hypothetical protein
MDTADKKQPVLSVTDPVSQDQLKRLQDLATSRARVADRLLSLEQEKVRLLVFAQETDKAQSLVFESVLAERGLPLDTKVEIQENGEIRVHPDPLQDVNVPQLHRPEVLLSYSVALVWRTQEIETRYLPWSTGQPPGRYPL